MPGEPAVVGRLQQRMEACEQSGVTVVIPARNEASRIGRCLDAIARLHEDGRIRDVIVVDDGSTDGTRDVIARYPFVQLQQLDGRGCGEARNVGWRAARTELIWFVDADCVPHADALDLLLELLNDFHVAGVGGSYSNLYENSMLACLIHEEIISRHRSMPQNAEMLATFNVVYRRVVLRSVGGFYAGGGEDAELAYRIRDAGFQLRFERRALVGHHHPTCWLPYLRKQAFHGFHRMTIYQRHPRRILGDRYSGLVDHLQPPLAMLCLATSLVVMFTPRPFTWVVPITLLSFLALLQVPRTIDIVQHSGRLVLGTYAVLGFARAFARGIGASCGVLQGLFRWVFSQTRKCDADSQRTQSTV